MLKKAGKVLIIDDNDDVLIAAKLLLKQHIARIETANTPNALAYLLKQETYDVILLDMNFTKDVSGGEEGFYWLQKILETDAAAVVVLITAYGDIELAVRAMKAGAVDFIQKPWHNEKLLSTVAAGMKLRDSRLENLALRSKQSVLSHDLDRSFQEFIGQSAAMQKVFATIEKVAKTDATVLILGENGTGKELVARALHRLSPRSGDVFISVDMGALSETLFESELFGHVKGAFTDAKQERAGRFEAASGGTLFLDEIGNLPLMLQAKLLTAIQSRQITPLGSNAPRPVDVRLVCATNLPIYKMVEELKFRQDLLYRINTVEITLPPLRERGGDILLLATHFLKLYATKYRKPNLTLSGEAIETLMRCRWRGNVRELQHMLERAVILCDADELLPQDFALPETELMPLAGIPKPTSGELMSTELTPTESTLEKLERHAIQSAMQKHHNSITDAARELGLTRASLYRRLEKYGL